jgi:ParB family chromosome partitioning protein
MAKLGNNPLLNRRAKLEDDSSLKKEKIIRQYGRMVHLKHGLVESIDFEDKLYINRLYEDQKELELFELKESIEKIGLLNIIYLQEKDEGRFRIVSGLRRVSAAKELYEDGKDVRARDRVVIFDKSTPYELLDSISVDENTKRKDLSILEQSYKFNREANKKNKKIEDILEEYGISKKTFYRVKNAINYPLELREHIEELGVDKAELISKIIEFEKDAKNIKDIVDECREKNRDELREVLKDLKKQIKVENVELKYSKRGLNFNVKKRIPDELKMYFERLKEKIEREDYSFIEDF